MVQTTRSIIAGGARLVMRSRRPVLALAVFIAGYSTMSAALPGGGWQAPVRHLVLLGLIAAAGWLLSTVLTGLEAAAITRVHVDVPDNRRARRTRTQLSMVRRITVVAVTVLTIGAMLMTFPAARTAGAGLLASAGVIGAIAAFAAQSLLGNVFAGLQIAFSDVVRLDDVVILEEEWGRIEEVTLTYLVIRLWDDRRLVMPTSYFMSKPFQNWTRTSAALIGTVELDVDWTLPVEELRGQLTPALDRSGLWDGRVGVLQVTDAVGGTVRVRALVSAADAPTLFDLRCSVREQLVGWITRNHPEALPRTRIDDQDRLHAPAPDTAPTDDGGVRSVSAA